MSKYGPGDLLEGNFEIISINSWIVNGVFRRERCSEEIVGR